MAKESGVTDVVVPKFDMHRHESKMTAKDVKLLARKYSIPLDLYPCDPTEVGKYAGGKIFNETFSEMKGWKDHF
nr:hypothetical protein [Tanacetum cinerariifolium]